MQLPETEATEKLLGRQRADMMVKVLLTALDHARQPEGSVRADRSSVRRVVSQDGGDVVLRRLPAEGAGLLESPLSLDE